MRGHIHVLKWLLQNNCSKNSYDLEEAISNNHLECAEWMRKNGFE